MSQNKLRVKPDIPVSIYGRVLGSNPRFQKHEKILEGEETCVRQTRGSRFSCYRVMVSSQGVLSGNNTPVMLLAGAK